MSLTPVTSPLTTGTADVGSGGCGVTDSELLQAAPSGNDGANTARGVAVGKRRRVISDSDSDTSASHRGGQQDTGTAMPLDSMPAVQTAGSGSRTHVPAPKAAGTRLPPDVNDDFYFS